MPKISFAKGQASIEVAQGENLMQTLLKNNMPVASSCNGQLVCSKCYVEVIEGSYNLSPPSQEERDLKEIKNLPENARMSCSCTVEGDIHIDTPYW